MQACREGEEIELLLVGQSRPLFVHFCNVRVKGRLQGDSNSDCQRRRRARWSLDHLQDQITLFVVRQ